MVLLTGVVMAGLRESLTARFDEDARPLPARASEMAPIFGCGAQVVSKDGGYRPVARLFVAGS